MEEIIDQFLWTKENKVITRDRHHVPGLANISHWNFKRAATPAEMHYHKDIFELHCMIHGRRMFQVLKNDRPETFIVMGNQAAITFPSQIHGYSDSFLEPYEFYSLQVDVSKPDCLLGLDKSYSTALYDSLTRIQSDLTRLGEQRLEIGKTHISLFRSAFTFFSAFDENSIRTGVQFLTCFLFSLQYLSPVTDTGHVDDHIDDSIQYMREHYLEKPSLETLSEISGYSLSHYKAKFREETGMTPANYLATLRLEYAKDKLARTNCSITKLAMDLNFSSPSHFCSAFKKRTSYTPVEYRRLNP